MNTTILHRVRTLFLLMLLGVALSPVSGQTYFRMSADFSVKIKRADGTMNLTRGKVYYDKNIQDLIYRVEFPREETWVVSDTSIYTYRGDTLLNRRGIPSINEFTIFHLSLNSTLEDFGLKKSRFKVSRVERKQGMVLSYWKMPKQITEKISFVVVGTKDNRLETVIIMGPESNVFSRQFYRDYIQIDAFEFPGQVVQIIYDEEGKENYQVTEFSNIRLNDIGGEALYRFQIKDPA